MNEGMAAAGAPGLPGEGGVAPRAAAYAFFALAGAAVAGAAWILLDSMEGYACAMRDPSQVDFWMALLPGPAAVLGAAAVHRPFMRAVQARRHGQVHAWAAAGALAAHAAYAALVFVAAAGTQALAHDVSPMTGSALDQAEDYALIAGGLALIFGFLPNVLVAEVFAGYMLGRTRAARAAQNVMDVSLSKGAGHATSLSAE